MKRILSFLLIGILWALPSGAMESREADQLFLQAGQAYKDARFDEAIRLGEEILSGGRENAAVYYNLGNAYLKNQDLGRAIVNYLRARSLSPRDADVRANLSFSHTLVDNYQDFLALRGLKKVFFFSQLSDRELKWIALYFFMFSGMIVLVGLYHKKVRIKRIIIWTAAASLLWVICLVSIGMRMAVCAGHAVVIKGVDAKYEPVKDATTYFRISEGAEVRLLRHEDGWAKIERPDGRSAWVPLAVVEKVWP